MHKKKVFIYLGKKREFSSQRKLWHFVRIYSREEYCIDRDSWRVIRDKTK